MLLTNGGTRHESAEGMKRFLKWTAAIAGVAIGSVFAVRAIQSARQNVKDALGRAEAIADSTRQTLEQTQAALDSARRAI